MNNKHKYAAWHTHSIYVHTKAETQSCRSRRHTIRIAKTSSERASRLFTTDAKQHWNEEGLYRAPRRFVPTHHIYALNRSVVVKAHAPRSHEQNILGMSNIESSEIPWKAGTLIGKSNIVFGEQLYSKFHFSQISPGYQGNEELWPYTTDLTWCWYVERWWTVCVSCFMCWVYYNRQQKRIRCGCSSSSLRNFSWFDSYIINHSSTIIPQIQKYVQKTWTFVMLSSTS